ncbi:MAG: IS110 family transposase [Acetobacteraceae bacterium]
MTEIICGVDVAAETLDARIGRDGAWQQFARTPEGIDALARFCEDHQVGLVVMEATGGYERQPFAQLWAAGLPTAIANPRSVRRFAEAMGVLEKTDRIDCAMIAWYAEIKRIKPLRPASAMQQKLTALVVRLRQLTELRIEQLNQRRLVTDADARASFEAILAAVARETRAIETRIADAIGADPVWVALDRAFRSIKGVADRPVARLMAEMPEIGSISNKAVAKLAGLAPIARDSGKYAGKRPVRGGREGVRSILFIVAEVVRRHEPDFAEFHRKLCAAGKPKKLVRVALARKLLVRLNAKARDVRIELANAA